MLPNFEGNALCDRLRRLDHRRPRDRAPRVGRDPGRPRGEGELAPPPPLLVAAKGEDVVLRRAIDEQRDVVEHARLPKETLEVHLPDRLDAPVAQLAVESLEHELGVVLELAGRGHTATASSERAIAVAQA